MPNEYIRHLLWANTVCRNTMVSKTDILHSKACKCHLLTSPTLTSMKDRIPENETSIPFTVYGSSTSFLPLCGSEYMRH